MHAGQESYRDGFAAVKEVSEEYRGLMAGLDRRTALWQLMNILAESPSATVVGKLHRSDRRVHFGRRVTWWAVGRKLEGYAIPEQAVKSAVWRLRSVLEKKCIMYSAWASSPLGNKKNKTGSGAVDVADFTVGLVHIEKLTKLSRYKGKKRVEPGS